MHQHHIALARKLQALQHFTEPQFMILCIVIGVARQLQSGAAEQGGVIAPGRIADMHRRRRRGRAYELGADAQGPASTGCLDGACAPPAAHGMRCAENHLFDGVVEFLPAGGGHVGFRRLGRQDDLLRAAHTLQYGGVAAEVAIDPDTEVHFLRECVGPKLGHQAEDGIGVQAVEMLKQMFMPHIFTDLIIGHGFTDIGRDRVVPWRPDPAGTS